MLKSVTKNAAWLLRDDFTKPRPTNFKCSFWSCMYLVSIDNVPINCNAVVIYCEGYRFDARQMRSAQKVASARLVHRE